MYKKIILGLLVSVGTLLHSADISAVIKKAGEIRKQKGAKAAGLFYMQKASLPEFNMNETRKLLNLGTAELIRDHADLAFQCVRRALVTPSKDRTENQRSYILLGRCYSRIGKPIHAIGALSNAVANPKDGHPSLLYSAWFYIGMAHIELKEYDAAKNAFEEAIKAGKKVTYRFSYKRAEQMLERIKNRK